MKDYIQQALRTESKPNLSLMGRMNEHARAVHAIFGLLTEIGELTDQFKRHIFYQAPLDLSNANEEVGDVLWYLAIMMDHVGIDFEACMEANIRKLRARYPNK